MSEMQRSRTTDRRYYGVMEGIVVRNDDPAQEGRVQVEFPWFDDASVSEWCRVRQLYAGGGYGTFFVPEVGDEVLVAFVHGDMRFPVVLGGLYNGQDKPPSHRTEDQDEKVIRTKAGHEIVLDDSDGKRKIRIVDADRKQSIEVDTEEGSITITAEGGRIVLASDEIEIRASQAVNIEGNTVSAQAKGTMDLEAASTMGIKGATVNIN